MSGNTHHFQQDRIETKYRALALSQAATEMGGIAVSVVANEGEQTAVLPSRRDGAQTARRAPNETTVEPGSLHLRLAGEFDAQGTTPLHARADQIQEQNAAAAVGQTPPTAA